MTKAKYWNLIDALFSWTVNLPLFRKVKFNAFCPIIFSYPVHEIWNDRKLCAIDFFCSHFCNFYYIIAVAAPAAIRVQKGIKPLNSECNSATQPSLSAGWTFHKALCAQSHSCYFGDSTVHTSDQKFWICDYSAFQESGISKNAVTIEELIDKKQPDLCFCHLCWSKISYPQRFNICTCHVNFQEQLLGMNSESLHLPRAGSAFEQVLTFWKLNDSESGTTGNHQEQKRCSWAFKRLVIFT